MTTSLLFRKDNLNADEFEVARHYFPTESLRSKSPPGLVIGRYSVLPHYRELELDLQSVGARLINSYEEHLYVANADYLQDVGEYPWAIPAYTERDIPNLPEGPYVVKGATNSRKYHWDTHMFAPSKRALLDVCGRLHQDGLIAGQRLVIRPYVELRSLERGLNGLNFAEEWRFFCLRSEVLCGGYYWSDADEAESHNRWMPPELWELAGKVSRVVGKRVNFFAVDVALTASGEAVLIEVNDGQMSGLGMVRADALYGGLRRALGGPVH